MNAPTGHPHDRAFVVQMLKFERSTKNTHVFKADKGEPIESLYIRKEAFASRKDDVPEAIEVSIVGVIPL